MRLPIFLLLALTSRAFGGMPSYSLSDVTRIRIEDLSFFLVLLLLSGLGVKWLWNVATKDIPRLPRLSYGRALAMTVLLGMFTVLLLSMISGARELLTPGAWRKQGSTYRLNDPANDSLRRKTIVTLRTALWSYAKARGGKFPKDDFDPELMHEIWETASEMGHRYIYTGGQALDGSKGLLAAEPDVFGDERYVLFSDGEIRKAASEEIARMLLPNAKEKSAARMP